MATKNIKGLKDFNKYEIKDIGPGTQVQLHNGFEWVHCEVVRLDPKWSGKFIGKLTTYFVKDVWLTKWDLIIAHTKNIYFIF